MTKISICLMNSVSLGMKLLRADVHSCLTFRVCNRFSGYRLFAITYSVDYAFSKIAGYRF